MYFLSKLFISLISPLGTALLLGLFAVILAFTQWRRCAVVWGCAAVMWLGLWSMPGVGYWVSDQLEADYPRIAVGALPKTRVMVVLGGGIVPSVDELNYPSLQSGADRVWHAARIYHAGKASMILLSGGRPSLTGQSEAQAMRVFLIDLGVPDEHLVMEDGSANSSENAKNTAKLLNDLGVSEILLVTSAFHMTRAKRLFEAQDLKVIPAATDYQARIPSGWRGWLPTTNALNSSSRAFKELVGRVVGR